MSGTRAHRQRPGQRAQRAGKAVRHPFQRADAADADHQRPRRDPRVPREHGDIILKPLFGNGGAGVFRLRPGTRTSTRCSRCSPALSRADHRAALSSRGAPGRQAHHPGRGRAARRRAARAAQGEARANLHVGGRAEKTTLTAREREICAAIGPTLREQGLLFVGIDVIGDYFTEINVTSPTGIQEINRLDGVAWRRVWDAIEARVAA